ncbi:trypsin-like serine protease [Kutzneria viridogrisea]
MTAATPTTLDVKADNGVDTCKGDAGGPAVRDNGAGLRWSS